MSDMHLSKDRTDLDNHGQLCITKFRLSPKAHRFNASGSHTARALTMADRVHPLNDTILKCLNRDDPLRHACLRTRWQAS
jgi:hypothetical protein